MTVEKKMYLFGILCLMGFAVAGCVGSAQRNAPGQVSEANSSFPKPEDAWQKQGSYPNIENLRTLRNGMNKDQVYGLVGRPHFDEGTFAEHTWNFIFNVPDRHGGYRACQYQLHFDESMNVDARVWRETECSSLLEPVVPEPAPIAESADALFESDSATLTPQGEHRIDSLMPRIEGRKTAPSITVVGHTDRLGSAAHNQALSVRRADAVRLALISRGVDEATISSWGEGGRKPVKTCPEDIAVEEQRACLAPNRRVDVRVGDR